MIYIDTSTLLAKYIRNDPFHRECITLSNTMNIEKISSYLTLLELFSAISRILHEKMLQIEPEILIKTSSKDGLITAIVSYILSDWDIHIPFIYHENQLITLKSHSILMDDYAALAIQLAPITKLKTLDNLHLAIAKKINEEQMSIDYFVTNDKGILNRKSIIKKYTKIEIVNPIELLELIK